jgi:hypothetical protein
MSEQCASRSDPSSALSISLLVSHAKEVQLQTEGELYVHTTHALSPKG